MNRLQDKVAIITGGGHGIGAALVQRFCEEGARVISVDVNHESGEKVARQFGATFKAVDVSDHNAVGELVAQAVRDFGRLDCLVYRPRITWSIMPHRICASNLVRRSSSSARCRPSKGLRTRQPTPQVRAANSA